MKTITTRQAADRIRNSGGKIFTVDFIKRGDGSLRRMIARTGVSKGVTGTGRKFDPASHGLLSVAELAPASRDDKGRFNGHEFTSGAFRCVSIEGIERLAIGGNVFEVVREGAAN